MYSKIQNYTLADKTIKILNRIEFTESDDWTNFVPIDGKGLTISGIQRINESIRTYVYCVLGSQAMTRQKITEIASDAQKQFAILVEDAIQGQTLVDSIKTFQNASILIRSTQSLTHSLEETKSQLDFAIGPNLQLLPSNMILDIGSSIGYNNSLLTANSNMKLGINENINLRIKSRIEKVQSTIVGVDPTSAMQNRKIIHQGVDLTKIKKDEQKITPVIVENKKVESSSHLNFTLGLIVIGILAELYW